MFEQTVLRAQSDTGLAPGAGPFVGLDRHAPAQNQLLAALPLADYERLLLDLEPVALPAGRTVHESGDEERYLYFLTAGIVCRFYGTENGSRAGLGITGNEGVIGVASFLGGESSPSQAEVLCAGYAYRLRAAVLKRQFEFNGPLPQLLLRYTRALFTQIGQSAACNRHHSLEQRLCRVLLSCRDRLPSNRIALTRRRLAHILGVRREGVTEAARRLQAAGLIHSIRGQVTILDRPGLEAQACECYEVVRRNHALLLDDYRRVERCRLFPGDNDFPELAAAAIRHRASPVEADMHIGQRLSRQILTQGTRGRCATLPADRSPPMSRGAPSAGRRRSGRSGSDAPAPPLRRRSSARGARAARRCHPARATRPRRRASPPPGSPEAGCRTRTARVSS